MKHLRLFLFCFMLFLFSSKLVCQTNENKKTPVYLVNGGYSWLKNSEDKFIDLSFINNYPILNYFYAFFEFDLSFGLHGNKNKYLLNLTPGLSLFLLNKSNLFVKLDLSAGPASNKQEEPDFSMGITSMMRIGVGWKHLGIFSQLNYFQFNNLGFEKVSFGINYIF